MHSLIKIVYKVLPTFLCLNEEMGIKFLYDKSSSGIFSMCNIKSKLTVECHINRVKMGVLEQELHLRDDEVQQGRG